MAPKKKQKGLKYNAEYVPKLARQFARLGYKDIEIAHELGIDESTFTRWKKKYPKLKAELLLGKKEIDDQIVLNVGQKLAKSKLTKTITEIDPVTKKPKSITYIENEVLPSAGLFAFWLKNRQGDKWRDKFVIGVDENEASEANDALAKIFKKDNKK